MCMPGQADRAGGIVIILKSIASSMQESKAILVPCSNQQELVGSGCEKL